MQNGMRDVWDRDGPVDRCVCYDQPFSDLLPLARAEQLDFDALCNATNCSTGCGMCAPYVRLMLATGRTSFPAMSELTIERVLFDLEQPTGK